MKWVAFYIKYLSEYDPFDIEVHGWQCEAESPEEAVRTKSYYLARTGVRRKA